MTRHTAADRGEVTPEVDTSLADGRPVPRSALPVPTDPHPQRRTTVQVLTDALERMVEDIDALREAGDIEALADGYAELDQFVKAARDVRNHAEDAIAGLMNGRVVNLDDRVTLERHGGYKRTDWDWDGLLHELGADRWIDPNTGECVVDTLREVVSLTASVSPRVGALRDRGIQADQFCEKAPARRTVTVRKAQP